MPQQNITTETKERKISADLIRVIAATAIIIMHVTSLVYYKLDLIGYKWWLVTNGLNWILKWGTPVFVMISGYFLLNSDNSNNPKTFYKRRLSKILVPYVFWCLIYYIINKGVGSLATPKDFFDQLWHSGTEYHLYFINVMFGLYLVTPLIKRLILNKNLNVIVPILFLGSALYLVLYSFFGFPQVSNIFNWFLPYLGYYLAGYWIGKKSPPKHPLRLIAISSLLLIIGVLITRKTFFLYTSQEMVLVLVKHFSIPVIIAANFLFYVAINLSNHRLSLFKKIARLSELSLGVYLIHPIWLLMFKNTKFFSTAFSTNYSLWLFGLIFLCVFFSFLSIYLIKKIPILNKLV